MNNNLENLDDSATQNPSGQMSSAMNMQFQVANQPSNVSVAQPELDSTKPFAELGSLLNPPPPPSPLRQAPSQKLVARPIRSIAKTRRSLKQQDLPVFETDADRFARSLGPQIHAVPQYRQRQLRSALITLIDASLNDTDPNSLYAFIEDWHTAHQPIKEKCSGPSQLKQPIVKAIPPSTVSSQQQQPLLVPLPPFTGSNQQQQPLLVALPPNGSSHRQQTQVEVRPPTLSSSQLQPNSSTPYQPAGALYLQAMASSQQTVSSPTYPPSIGPTDFYHAVQRYQHAMGSPQFGNLAYVPQFGFSYDPYSDFLSQMYATPQMWPTFPQSAVPTRSHILQMTSSNPATQATSTQNPNLEGIEDQEESSLF